MANAGRGPSLGDIREDENGAPKVVDKLSQAEQQSQRRIEAVREKREELLKLSKLYEKSERFKPNGLAEDNALQIKIN